MRDFSTSFVSILKFSICYFKYFKYFCSFSTILFCYYLFNIPWIFVCVRKTLVQTLSPESTRWNTKIKLLYLSTLFLHFTIVGKERRGGRFSTHRTELKNNWPKCYQKEDPELSSNPLAAGIGDVGVVLTDCWGTDQSVHQDSK